MSFLYEGRHRGQIVATEIIESPTEDSQAVGFAMAVNFNEYYYRDQSGWYAITDANRQVVPNITETVVVWIVGKSGNLNENGVRQLAEAIGWDGDAAKLASNDWAGVTIQCDVKSETYEGKWRLKGSWIYAAEAAVGGFGKPLETQRLGLLTQQHGGALRALCGTAAPKPGGKPAAPPKPHAAPKLAPSDDEIPF